MKLWSHAWLLKPSGSWTGQTRIQKTEIRDKRWSSTVIWVCMGEVRHVNHVYQIKIRCQAVPESHQVQCSYHLCTLHAVAIMVVDTENLKTRGTRTESRWSNMTFETWKSCNDDKKGLTKTLLKGNETGVRQPGPKPRRMHVVERGGQEACFGLHSLYRQVPNVL